MTDSKVEFAGKELIQGDPLALESKAMRPGAHHLQLALQAPNLARGLLQFGQRLLHFTPQLLFFIPALFEVVHRVPNNGKSQETGEAVPMPNHLMRVVMVGEDIHKKPTCPAQNRYAERSEPAQIPTAHANRDEVENKEKELVAGN